MIKKIVYKAERYDLKGNRSVEEVKKGDWLGETSALNRLYYVVGVSQRGVKVVTPSNPDPNPDHPLLLGTKKDEYIEFRTGERVLSIRRVDEEEVLRTLDWERKVVQGVERLLSKSKPSSQR